LHHALRIGIIKYLLRNLRINVCLKRDMRATSFRMSPPRLTISFLRQSVRVREITRCIALKSTGELIVDAKCK